MSKIKFCSILTGIKDDFMLDRPAGRPMVVFLILYRSPNTDMTLDERINVNNNAR